MMWRSLGSKLRGGVHEIDTGSFGGLLKAEAIARQDRGWIDDRGFLGARLEALVYQRESQLHPEQDDQRELAARITSHAGISACIYFCNKARVRS